MKAAIIFASGFAEIGEEGVMLQQDLATIAKEHGIRIIGPEPCRASDTQRMV
ncbi:hypothetical protein LSPH24S_01459 [Lysinibacillus sphaericus]